MKHSPAPTRAEFIEMTEAIKRDQILRDAAPDLLEACKELKDWHDRNDPVYTSYFHLKRIMDKVNSAIAKAEGINKC